MRDCGNLVGSVHPFEKILANQIDASPKFNWLWLQICDFQTWIFYNNHQIYLQNIVTPMLESNQVVRLRGANFSHSKQPSW
jgi:hypothetical protein